MGLQKYSDMTWLTAKKTVLNFHIHINEIWSHICCISLVIVNFTFVSLSYQLGYWVQCWMQLMKIEFLALFSNSEFFPHISTVHQFSSVQFSSVAQLWRISPGCSLEGLMLKLKPQYFCRLMWRANSLAGKDWGQEQKGATEDETVGWHHQFNGQFEQTQGDSQGVPHAKSSTITTQHEP